MVLSAERATRIGAAAAGAAVKELRSGLAAMRESKLSNRISTTGDPPPPRAAPGAS